MTQDTHPPTKPGDDPADVDFHVMTVAHFFRVLKAVNDALAGFETGEDATGKDLRQTTSELRKTYQMVAEEKSRLESVAARTRGAHAREEVFDADDIRQRLADRIARLDDTGASEGVP